ncbi:MAG: radical SAM protein [Deltaproteobacteria bacterium]|nr:radical SAM protein [Deltaproteobacteria bacterium]
MKILLVNPAFPPSLWDFEHCRDLDGSRYAHPPLSLPTLAALTPPGHAVRLLDENVGLVDLDADAALVGLTGYWMQRERVFELADAFRARGRTVALGGPLVEESTLEECARHADVVFLGEAELTWPRFLRELEAGTAGAVYRQEEFVDLADSPLPRFELLDRRAYSTATIETSRGCPMTCEFCEIPTRLGRRPRTKSIPQVLAEVRALHALGADSIFFVDDNFVGDRRRAKALLEELARFARSIGYAIDFSCQITIDAAKDEALLELLYAANIRRVFVGLESPRPASLKEAGKRQNLATEVQENIRRLQERNIAVWAGMIVGFDHDDAGIFDEHLRFLAEAGVPVVMSGLLQAIPGTPLYRRMEAAGRLREVEMAGVRGRLAAAVTTNIVPRGLTDEELRSGYLKMLRALYDEEAYGDRLLTALRRSRRPTQPKRGAKVATTAGTTAGAKLGPERRAILGRILKHYLLTRDARRRRLFLRVVLETLRHAPAQLESALFHLVVYKHLRHFHERLSAQLPREEPGRSPSARDLRDLRDLREPFGGTDDRAR